MPRRVVVPVAAALLVLVAASVTVRVLRDVDPTWVVAFDTLVGLAYLALAAWVLSSAGARSGTDRRIAVAAALAGAGWVVESTYALGTFLWALPTLWLLFAFPAGRVESRLARVSIAMVAVATVSNQVWLAVGGNPLEATTDLIVAASLPVTIVALVRHVRRMGPVARRLAQPMTAATLAFGVLMVSSTAWTWAFSFLWPTYLFTELAGAAVAVGAWAALLRLRLARASVGLAVSRLAALPAGASPAATLAEAVGDPDLALLPLGDAEAARPGRERIEIAVGGAVAGVLDVEAPLAKDDELARGLADAAALWLAQERRATSAAEHERDRLSRDLHDGAQQNLLAIALMIRSERSRIADDPEQAAQRLEQAEGHLRAAIEDLRALSRGDDPVRGDLGTAIANVLAQLALETELDVRLNDPPSDELARTVYYVVCEAIANAVKHGEPRRIAVVVEQDTRGLRAAISDDGKGGALPTPGGGLEGLARRAAALGGGLHVADLPGGGTRVELTVPSVPEPAAFEG